jgi:sugar O-acyltransferase (sialic acid O-acetyltransferase NeuD family)
MSDLVIFATGDLARWVRVLFERETEHAPVAFTVHAEYLGEERLDGLPVVPFEEIVDSHPPDRNSLFVASGYRGLNGLRAETCAEARAAGYELPNLVSGTSSVHGELGDNVAVSPGAHVMPYASVGSGTILAVGATVSHDARVGESCYLSPQACVLGRAVVGDRCFIGGGARIRNGVKVGERCVIGAGALIMKDTPSDSVHSVPGTPAREIHSSELADL